MAAGDFTSFQKGRLDVMDGSTHIIGTHEFKCAFVNNTLAPTEGLATPALGDFTEVTPGGNYSAGGFTITLGLTEAAGTVSCTVTGNIAMVKNASNPTDVYWGIIYNNTNAGKEAVGFVEIAATGADGTAGAINVNWSANLFTMTKP